MTTSGTTFRGRKFTFSNGSWKIERDEQEDEKQKEAMFTLTELDDDELPEDDGGDYHLVNSDFFSI